MDNVQISAETVNKLSDREKQELNRFIANETQKANIQSTIHSLTDTCFKKCVTSKISQGALDRSEEPCMRNCVDRFMDANMTAVQHLEKMRSIGGAKGGSASMECIDSMSRR